MSDDKPSPDQEPWRDQMVPAQSYAAAASSLGLVPGSAPSLLRQALASLSQIEMDAISREAKEIVERAHRAAKEQIADLESHRGKSDGPHEPLTSEQLRAAIIEAVNDGDSADAIHYAMRWRRVQNSR